MILICHAETLLLFTTMFTIKTPKDKLQLQNSDHRHTKKTTELKLVTHAATYLLFRCAVAPETARYFTTRDHEFICIGITL